MNIEIVTDIKDEPVTLNEVKDALKITGTGHDDDLELLMRSAREWVEKALNVSVSERDLKVTSDIEIDEWDLPYGPVSGEVTESTDTDDNYIYEYTGGYSTPPEGVRRLILQVTKYWYDIDDITDHVPLSIKRMIQAHTRNPML